MHAMDICFLIASSSKKSYQKLYETYVAIETPTWALLLAQSCRSIGFKVHIVDANAENLSKEQVLKRITECKSELAQPLIGHSTWGVFTYALLLEKQDKSTNNLQDQKNHLLLLMERY